MDRLEQLDNLSIWPRQMTKQIRSAGPALRQHSEAAQRNYAALSFVAEVAAGMCRTWWQLGASWLVLLALLRVLRLDWNLPPGPWWKWTMLFEFSTDLVVRTTLLLAVLLASLILACRAAGRHLYSSLKGSHSLRSRWLATGQALLIAGSTPMVFVSGELTARANTGPNTGSETGCHAAWDVSALGESWWLLQCPVDEDPAAQCQVIRGSTTESFPPGRRIVISSGRLERMEFAGFVGHCATSVRLVDDRLPEQRIDLRVQVPAPVVRIIEQPVKASASEALNRFGAALANAVAQIPRTIEIAAHGESPTIPEALLNRLVKSQEDAAKAASEQNEIAAAELRLRTSCETARKARKLNKRAEISLHGDPNCIEAIQSYDNGSLP